MIVRAVALAVALALAHFVGPGGSCGAPEPSEAEASTAGATLGTWGARVQGLEAAGAEGPRSPPPSIEQSRGAGALASDGPHARAEQRYWPSARSVDVAEEVGAIALEALRARADEGRSPAPRSVARPDGEGATVHVAPLGSTSGPRAIYLHCNITQPSVSLNASAEEQLAVLTGRVTVDYITVVVVTVALSCSMDLGWPSAIQPTEMSFNAPGSLPFTVNVTVPAGTSNRSAVLTVRAVASVQGVPSDSDQDQATIAVGTQAGTGPVEPPPRPGGGKREEVRVLNMPLLVSLASLAAVLGTFVALGIRRGTRKRRGGPSGRGSGGPGKHRP